MISNSLLKKFKKFACWFQISKIEKIFVTYELIQLNKYGFEVRTYFEFPDIFDEWGCRREWWPPKRCLKVLQFRTSTDFLILQLFGTRPQSLSRPPLIWHEALTWNKTK